MPRAYFRFFAELQDFLPRERKGNPFVHHFTGNPGVKDIIESLGVPHPEVELLFINDESSDFNHPLLSGDHVSVYPAFISLDVSSVSKVKPPRLEEKRFVLDAHLGKLAQYLRMFGFDCLWKNSFDDPELARISHDERRILLTRDLGLLKRSEVIHGHWMRATDPKAQLLEIIDRYDLLSGVESAEEGARRCLKCNELLEPVRKEQIEHRLPDMTRELYDEFFSCYRCDKIYWKGSHYENMIRWMDEVIAREKP